MPTRDTVKLLVDSKLSSISRASPNDRPGQCNCPPRRVVPGIPTMAMSSPASALSSVDLPGSAAQDNEFQAFPQPLRRRSTARAAAFHRGAPRSGPGAGAPLRGANPVREIDQRFLLRHRLAQRLRQRVHAACRASAPSSASRRWASVSAAIKSAIASASSRFIFPLACARRENSPGSASRAPSAVSAALTAENAARPPCSEISALSSPVKFYRRGK